MFKSCSCNTYKAQSGSFMNESTSAASSSFCARLSMDTVIAVSIFVILGIISSVIVLAELSVIILAILSVVIIASVLLVVIIGHKPLGRLNEVKA